MDPLELASDHFEYTKQIRRDLHRHPELGFQEFRTASLVADQLKLFGFQVKEGIGKTGVVGLLDTGRPGKVILVRFDMDALPITEKNNCEYKSLTPGVMHACGHDGHVAVGLTVARIVAENRELFSGSLKVVFQPAEEGLGGAESMIADGVLKDPQPQTALAIHLWNEKPLGWLGISPGSLMAGADMVTIHITGHGGHGAIPQDAADPVIAGAQIILGLQTIVSRNLSPFEPVVVGITEFHAGEAHNIIPDDAILRGTIRTFNPETRELVISRINQITQSISEGMGCSATIEITPLTPAVINDPVVTNMVTGVARKILLEMKVDSSNRVLVSDDMAFFLEKIPGCYIMIGSADPLHDLSGHHHSANFDFAEPAMQTAVALLIGSLSVLSQS